MKYIISLLIFFIISTSIASFASVEFDPSQYTIDELKEIISISRAYISDNNKTSVLYDKDGVQIEYFGLVEDSLTESTMLDLLITNNSSHDMTFKLDGINVNNAKVSTSNGYITVEKNTMFRTVPNFSMIVDINDLRAYGISTIETIDIPLTCYYDNGSSYEDLLLHVDTDYQIN